MRTFLQIKLYAVLIWFSLSPLLIHAETEPNNAFSQAGLLVSGSTMNGELGKTDNGITDTEDWYKIVVTGNSSAEFTFQTDNVLRMYYLTLYSASGENVAFRNDKYFWSYNGTLTVPDLAAGTYYLKLLRGDKAGSYTLQYTSTSNSLPNDAEPNDSFKKAPLLTDEQAVTGHLGYYRIDGSDRDIQDWYKIEVEDNSAVEFSFQTDNVLRIYYLTVYSFINDSTVQLRNEVYYWSYNGKMRVPDLAAGTYYLRLLRGEGYGNYTLNYNLIPNSLPNDIEPNDNFKKALLLKDQQPVTGHLGYYYTPNGSDRDMQDWYKIEVTDNIAGEFTFQTDSILRMYYMTLYTIVNDSTVKLRNEIYFWSFGGKMTVRDLAAGTYYLRMLRGDGYGNYTLNYKAIANPSNNDAEPNNDFKQSVPIQSGETLPGKLGFDYSGSMDIQDWYKITLPVEGKAQLTFHTDSVLRMYYVTLYSAKNDSTIERRNEVYYWSYNGTMIIPDLAAGTYYVRLYRGEGYGDYNFTYNMIPNPLANDTEADNNYKNAITLNDKKPLTGHLGYYYQANGSDRDMEDWYKVVIPDNAKAEFSFQTDSILRMYYLTLYSAKNDSTIERRNEVHYWSFGGTMIVPDLAAGTYYLKLLRGDGYGNYTVNYNLIPNPLANDSEPDDNFKNSVLLSDNKPVTGHLGYFYHSNAPDRDIQDWYKVVIPDNAKAEFTFQTDSILRMYYMTLYSSPNDSTVQLRNDYYSWNFGGKMTVPDLAAGTYYFRLLRGDGYGGYTLTYKLIPVPLANDPEPDNSFKNAMLLTEDGTTGHLGYYYLSNAPDRDVEDWFKIIVTQNAKAEFTFQTDSILRMYYMTLYSAPTDSTIQFRNEVYRWDYTGKLTVYDLTPGTYYLRLLRGAEYGSYILSYNKKYYTIGFETAQYNNDVKIINKSNGDIFEWDFGDGTSSTAKYPEHTYTRIGDFVITQKVKVTNSSTFWVARDTVSIRGIERFTPNKAGNGGDMIMTVYGGGLDETVDIKLIKGGTVLTPEKVLKAKLGMVDAIFDLHFVDEGVYDVSVGFKGQTPVVFPNGLTIEGLQYPHVVTSGIEGYGTLRTGRTWPYNLVLTNTGNSMARGVNAYIVVPDMVELYSNLKPFSSTINETEAFIYHDDELDKDFSVSYSKVKQMMDFLRTDYIKIDTLFGEPFKGKAYPVFVPFIAANSTFKVPFSVKSISGEISEESSMYSFVMPVNMFGSCNSPFSTEMVNKLVDVMLANLDKLPIVDKNPYLKTFVKVTNIGKTALRNAASYFGYLSGGMSSDEAYYEAYIKDGQLDKANAEVVTGLLEWGAELGLDKLKNVSMDQLNQYKADRLEYLKKALQENKAGDKFGTQLYKGFAKDYNERFERLKELRDMLNDATKLKDANSMMNDFSDLMEAYANECPELNKLLNTFKKHSNDYSGKANLLNKPLRIGTSVDPNEIAGPQGYLSQRFIPNTQSMDYVIRFENKASAPLAAQIVNVYDTLDVAKYDFSTFELSDITIGDSVIQMPRGRDTYFTTFDLRPKTNLLVSISAKLDTLTGIAHWQFVSLDPVTKDLTNDPLLGFLPPNVSAPEGEGSVSYTIRLKSNLAHATTISNRANIVFDYNKPIITNLWKNAIDSQAPSGAVSSVPQLTDSTFTVNWSGNDAGSQIRYFELYGSKDNAAFISLGKFTGNSATFRGDKGSNYRFCVVPADSVGNIPNKDIVSEGSVTLNPTGLMEVTDDGLIISPVPAKDVLYIQWKSASPNDNYTIEFISMNGSSYRMSPYTAAQLKGGIALDIKAFTEGHYLIRISGTKSTVSSKLIIR